MNIERLLLTALLGQAVCGEAFGEGYTAAQGGGERREKQCKSSGENVWSHRGHLPSCLPFLHGLANF